MRALRFLVVILALATGEGIRAQTMPPAPTLTGVISGVVRDMATGAPLAGVAVHLTPIAGSPRAAGENPYDIETDDRGQFAFTKLPAGRYSELRAHLGGFFDASFKIGVPAAERTTIALADGQHFTANITLAGMSSISGRVTNETGTPAPGAYVQLLVTQPLFGADRVFAGPVAQTNERGEYAFPSLRSGSFRVMVLATEHTRASTTAAPVYPQLFFPDVNSFGASQPLVLPPGESRAGIDFVRRHVDGHRVSGRLQGSADAFAGLMLRLVPDGLMDVGPRADAATTIVDKDGTFMFLNVPSGDYTLVANRTRVEFTYAPSSTSSATLPKVPGLTLADSGLTSNPLTLGGQSGYRYTVSRQSGPTYDGHQRMSVEHADVKDVVVEMQPTASLRVAFDESQGPSTLMFRLQLDPVGAGLQPFAGGITKDRPVIDGIPPGEYVLRSSMLFDRLTLGDEDVFGRPIRIDQSSAGRTLTVRMARKLTRLVGIVRDGKGAVVPAANVLVFPVDESRWPVLSDDPVGFRCAQATTDGYVDMSTQIPGEYYVVAVPADRDVTSPSVDFMRVAKLTATKVTIAADKTAVVEIKLLTSPPRGE